MQLPREWIGLALVVLGLVRATLLVAHDPLVGYGNQYDMIRTSACLGLFPSIPEPARYEAHPEAPLPIYHTEAVRRDLCYPSTEVVVVAAVVSAAHAMGAGAEFRLRWVGFAKVLLLAITVLIIAWALHPHPTAALLNGVIVFALLCDPMVTLWFNTLYTEFGAIWALYASIAAIVAFAITERGVLPLTLVLIAALAGLAFSREQFSLLGPAMVLVSWPWLWQRSPHLTVAAFGVAIVASMVSFDLTPRPADVKLANRADAYLGMILPAASDKRAAVAALGLPERCASVVGASWYLQRGENLSEACPEVFMLSSTDFVRVARVEPEAMGRAIARALPATQEIAAPYLGTLEGARDVPVNALPWWLASPLHAIVWRLPLKAYVSLVLTVAFAAPLALLAALGWAQPSRTQHGAPLLLAMLLGGVAIYALLTTVLGDGMSEAARHFLPGSLAVYAAWIALVFALPSVVLRWTATPKDCALEMVVAVVAVVVIVLGTWVSFRWAQAQPLAIGTLDEPASRKAAAGVPLKLRGWAIDPSGIESVTVEVGALRRDAHTGEASAKLKRAFPSYPDSDGAGYSLEISAADLAAAGAPGPVALRVLAKSVAGPTMEIDRRRLDFGP